MDTTGTEPDAPATLPRRVLLVNAEVRIRGRIDEAETTSWQFALGEAARRAGLEVSFASGDDAYVIARATRFDACVLPNFGSRAWLSAFVRTIGYRPVLLLATDGSPVGLRDVVERAGFDGWVPDDQGADFVMDVVRSWIVDGSCPRCVLPPAEPVAPRGPSVSSVARLDALPWPALREESPVDLCLAV